MNAAVNAFFLILKLLSLYFLVVSLFSLCKRKMQKSSTTQRRFAVLIAARNEESCIAGLIESLLAQNYPSELFDIWVLPNNCTDHTADAARHAGGKVLEMPTSIHSKGAALQYAANTLLHGSRYYDAFCVFDADNEVDPAFLSEMNQALSRSAIVKSRILAKNRMQAGISACYEIYFLYGKSLSEPCQRSFRTIRQSNRNRLCHSARFAGSVGRIPLLHACGGC